MTGAGVAVTGAATANVGTLAATAGCGTAPALTNGTHTIFSGGQNRSFILRLPNNYDRNHPHRLIFGFHWLGGAAEGRQRQTSGWPFYGLASTGR